MVTWVRIENWLAAHAPIVLDSLNPPAPWEEIAATEKLIGRELPDDVVRSYQRHNGQQGEGGLFGGELWHDMAGVRNEWSVWQGLIDGNEFEGTSSECDGDRISQDWWNPGWVPFTADGGGNSHCVDLSPGPTGVAGQVIEMIHDDGFRPWHAANFGQWLQAFADDLEAGKYTTHKDYCGLVLRSDLK